VDGLNDAHSSAILEAVYRHAPFAILVADAKRNIVTCNPAFERLFGYCRDEIAGQSTKMLYANSEEYRRTTRFFDLEAHPDTRVTRQVELYYRKKDGEVFLADVVGQTVCDGTDTAIATVGMFRNISQQKRIEFQYEQLFRYAPVFIMQKDSRGRVLRINDDYAAFLGFRSEEIIGRDSAGLQPWVGNRIRADDQAVLESGKPLLNVVRKVWSPTLGDGWLFMNKIPLTDPVTGESTLLTIGMDVTEMKKREAELEARSSALESFAYMASHDLQEPLRKIAVFGSILQDGDSEPEERDHAASVMIGSAQRARAMIADLLAYSRANSEAINRTRIGLKSLVGSVLEALSWAIEEAQAEIVVEVGDHRIEADRLQTELLLQNLVSNALKYRSSKAPCRIEIAAGGFEGGLRLSVTDNGIGIAPENIDSIFLPFVRLHSRSQYPGTGIGLAICKAVTDRHGWSIGAQPLKSRGIEFWIDIPEMSAPIRSDER